MTHHFLSRARQTLAAVGLLALGAVAGPAANATVVYHSVGLTYAQTGLVITPDNGGYRDWQVSASLTNNTSTVAENVHFWLLGLALRVGGGNLIDASWNNAAQYFETPDAATAAALNNDAYLDISLSDLVLPPSSLINPGDDLPAWSLGTINIGQTVSFTWTFRAGADVTEARPIANFVGTTTQVPEPGSLALAGLALAGLALAGRRTRH